MLWHRLMTSSSSRTRNTPARDPLYFFNRLLKVSPAPGSRLFVGLAVALLGVTLACAPDDPTTRGVETAELTGESIRLRDDAGREVDLPRPPRRIVSLVPSATETLLALGAGHRLVARTDYDTLPGVRSLPSVGGGLHPNLERLVALDPDLVIRFAGPSDRNTPARLTEMGIAHVAVRPDGIEDVRRIVEMMGRVVGASERADSLVARMDSTLAGVAERVRPHPPRQVAFVLGGSPPWVAGPGTFVDELIRLAGGENAFADLGELYGPVSREAFVSRDIDLVLTTRRGELDFVPSDLPVRRVPPGLETPSLDLGKSAGILARILHPDAFAPEGARSGAARPDGSQSDDSRSNRSRSGSSR